MQKVTTNRKKQSLPRNQVPAHNPKSPPPPQHSHVHAPSQPLFESIKQGFGFGVGSSMGNKLVNSIFNSKTEEHREERVKIDREDNLLNIDVHELYNKCLEEKNNTFECSKILENK
jgi:hypothetical protein